jgi:hypothetical protein
MWLGRSSPFAGREVALDVAVEEARQPIGDGPEAENPGEGEVPAARAREAVIRGDRGPVREGAGLDIALAVLPTAEDAGGLDLELADLSWPWVAVAPIWSQARSAFAPYWPQ